MAFGADCPRLFPRRFPCVVEGYSGDVSVYNCHNCPSSVDGESGLVFFPLEGGCCTCLFPSLVDFLGGEGKGRCLGGGEFLAVDQERRVSVHRGASDVDA